MAEAQLLAEGRRPLRAPVLLAVTQTLQRDHKIPTMEQRLSAGAFCQNLLVAAHASGFVAQWLTEWPAYDDEVKAALGHRPETDIVGFIYIGSAAEPRRNVAAPTSTRWSAIGLGRQLRRSGGHRPTISRRSWDCDLRRAKRPR